jgi:tetratricopeptide (TPR) repeat protein
MQMKNIHYQNALHLIKNNNISDAVKELKLCLKFNRNDTAALNLLGLAYYLKCRFEKAEQKWRKSLSLRRENNKAVDYIELITKNDFIELRRRYKKILFNDEVDEKIKIAFLEGIIAEHEELIEPYVILALLYKRKGRHEQALTYLYDAYDLDSGNNNIKDYILECEGKNQKQSFYSFDFLKKRKTVSAFMLIFLLSITIILLINTNEFSSSQKAASQTEQLSVNTSQENTFFTSDNLEVDNQQSEDNEKDDVPLKSGQENSAQNIFQNNKDITLEKEKLFSTDFNYKNIHLNYSEIQEVLKQARKKEELNQFKSSLEAGNAQQLFQEGLENFRNDNYEEAVLIFDAIYSLSDVDYLKRESLYLLARTHEIQEDFNQAEYFYKQYLKQYQESNYYEVVLYNLGLMYDQIGKNEASREILNRLRKERPYSQYNNSRVYDILNESAE